MAAPECGPASGPSSDKGEEETILYDLLVNTEWPPETEVQVKQALTVATRWAQALSELSPCGSHVANLGAARAVALATARAGVGPREASADRDSGVGATQPHSCLLGGLRPPETWTPCPAQAAPVAPGDCSGTAILPALARPPRTPC